MCKNKPYYWGEGEKHDGFFITTIQNSIIARCSFSMLKVMFGFIEKAPVLSNKGFGADKRT